jgi:sugar phosphate isomerase/epimerase
MATISHELLAALPATLRRRFASLDKYTKEITLRQLEKRNLSKKAMRDFLRNHLAEVQGAVLAIAVFRYLEDGIAAAEGAITIAKSLGVEGFTVGSTAFSEDSQEVADWRAMHAALELVLKEHGIDQYAIGRHSWDHVSNMLTALIDGKVD